MEIVISVIIIFVVILILGGLDNNRPVKSWSDAKLARMHGKLLRASSASSQAGYFEKASEQSQKAKEVEQEIERRKLQQAQGSDAKNLDVDNIQEFTYTCVCNNRVSFRRALE